MPDQQIGVLIDYENVGLGSMQALFDQLSDLGRIIIKRAYADWSKAASKSGEMLELGIEPKHYFRTPGSAKNASDICLAIDAIDLLYRTPLDTFVIVSSDTDFVPLVSTLRAAGKIVIGVGRRGVVSPALVNSCDRYIFLDEGEPTAQHHSDLKEQAQSLLIRATGASTDDMGQVVAAKLHNTMRRLDPSFDFRALGYRTFSQFLASSPAVKVDRPRGRGDVSVELATPSNHVIESVRDTSQTVSSPLESSWDAGVDEAWARIPGELIAGSKAAAEAAKVLGVSKLSASKYKNLQGLLEASEMLQRRWTRRGNAILRREQPDSSPLPSVG